MSDAGSLLLFLLPSLSEALLPHPGVKMVSKGGIEDLWGLRLEIAPRGVSGYFSVSEYFCIFFGRNASFPSLMSLL